MTTFYRIMAVSVVGSVLALSLFMNSQLESPQPKYLRGVAVVWTINNEEGHVVYSLCQKYHGDRCHYDVIFEHKIVEDIPGKELQASS